MPNYTDVVIVPRADRQLDVLVVWNDQPPRNFDSQWSAASTVAASAAPPSISAFSPVPATITRVQAIAFTVTDSLGIASVTVTANYTGIGYEVVYANGAFTAPFAAMSSATPSAGAIAFSVVRTNGWRGSFTLDAAASNTEGAASSSAGSYTVPAGIGDTPSAANFSPTSGTPISKASTIEFDVLDYGATFAYISISVLFSATGATECVWRAGAFTPYYAGSTRTATTNGYHYTVRRSQGGWPSAPLISVDVVDTDGGVSS